jgi:hypothetical protein
MKNLNIQMMRVMNIQPERNHYVDTDLVAIAPVDRFQMIHSVALLITGPECAGPINSTYHKMFRSPSTEQTQSWLLHCTPDGGRLAHREHCTWPSGGRQAHGRTIAAAVSLDVPCTWCTGAALVTSFFRPKNGKANCYLRDFFFNKRKLIILLMRFASQIYLHLTENGQRSVQSQLN